MPGQPADMKKRPTPRWRRPLKGLDWLLSLQEGRSACSQLPAAMGAVTSARDGWRVPAGDGRRDGVDDGVCALGEQRGVGGGDRVPE
jgi:hypothetical protein